MTIQELEKSGFVEHETHYAQPTENGVVEAK